MFELSRDSLRPFRNVLYSLFKNAWQICTPLPRFPLSELYSPAADAPFPKRGSPLEKTKTGHWARKKRNTKEG